MDNYTVTVHFKNGTHSSTHGWSLKDAQYIFWVLTRLLDGSDNKKTYVLRMEDGAAIYVVSEIVRVETTAPYEL